MSSERIAQCWIDAFDLSRFRGRRRRLMGPGQFNEIRSHDQSWGIGIDSLIAGPETFIRFYRAAEPDGPSVWIMPRQAVSDLPAHPIGDELDSLEMLMQPPTAGHPGYAAFTIKMERSGKSRSG